MALRMWFLESIEAETKDKTDLQTILDNFSDDERFMFEERAGIMEYDGGLSREDAEKEAMKSVYRLFGKVETINRISKFL